MVSCSSSHYLTMMALLATWEYEPNDIVKGVVKGVERHVTVRHADRQRIQNSKKRIHKVRSMSGKTRCWSQK